MKYNKKKKKLITMPSKCPSCGKNGTGAFCDTCGGKMITPSNSVEESLKKQVIVCTFVEEHENLSFDFAFVLVS
jgi:hypothetical protein